MTAVNAMATGGVWQQQAGRQQPERVSYSDRCNQVERWQQNRAGHQPGIPPI